MKILLISPAAGIPTVYPFKGYGGIERIVADLANELRKHNHVVVAGTLGTTAGDENISVPHENAFANMDPIDSDITLDFSHLKLYPYGKFSIPFWSDAVGSYPIFPTKAVLYGAGQYTGEVIYPGIDTRNSHTNTPEDYYIYLGRIAPYKGIDLILYLMKHLHIKVKFYGHTGRYADHDYVKYVSNELNKMGAEPIHSDVGEDEKMDALSRSRGLIFPPDWSLLHMPIPRPVESLGLTAIEALSCGVPVFTNDLISGVREIIAENRYGLTLALGQWRKILDYDVDDEMVKQSFVNRSKYFSSAMYAKRIIAYARGVVK